MKIFLLLVLLLFLSCSDQAGGTGTETTNGFVALSDGSPAAGAIVRVRKSSQWYEAISKGESTLLDSVVCNEQGFYDFGILYDESHIYEVTHGDESTLEALQIKDTLHLKQSVTLSGTVPTGVTTVLLGGTDYTATVVQDSFHFTSLPRGYFPLFYQEPTGVSLASGIWIDQEDELFTPVDHSGLLLNDFVAGFDRSPMDYVTNILYWYTYSDSCSRTYKDGLWEIKSLSEHGGSSSVALSSDKESMILDVTLGDKWDYPFGGVGAVLLKNGNGYNLEKMDTLKFRARGSGVFRMALESKILDTVSDTHYGTLCTLTTDWKEYLVPVDELHIYNKDSVHSITHPWSSVAKEINRLECGFLHVQNKVEQELHLELDWIVFGGLKIEDL